MTKSQLYLGTYNGGYSDEWLYKIKDRFEEAYKDISFEKDKKGVQVYIDTSTTYSLSAAFGFSQGLVALLLTVAVNFIAKKLFDISLF